MRFKILLFVALIATTTKNWAQEATSYRGAFAPAPVRQWTDEWANFNAQNTAYPASNVTVSGDITSNTTWTKNNVYLLSGIVYVKDGVTLTIEPGTIIRGAAGVVSGSTVTTYPGALVVARGGKIMAEGTACNPIVFTSNEATGNRSPGNWGGVIILGKAKHNLGTNNLIEGLPNTNPDNFHGGTDDADNSGVLKYVRIEYAGFIFSANNEINSLTMGSVGNGTVIDYVQVSHGDDDGFEWFGGSVNCKHLVVYHVKDDDLDTDNGYSGTVQYVLAIKDPNFSDVSQSEGFESDNSATGIAGQFPKTSAKFANVTQIGAFRCASNTDATGMPPSTLFLHRRGARVRRNSDLKIVNSILMNNWRGLFVDNAVVGANPTQPTTNNYNEDSAVYRNNIIAGDFTTTWTGTTYNGTKSLAYENAASRTIGTNTIYSNDSINTCSLLIDPWNANPVLADFRPNVAGAGSIVTSSNGVNNGPDLSTSLLIDDAGFTTSQTRDALVVITEIGQGTSNGTIIVEIPKLLGWDITIPSLTLTATDQIGTATTSNVVGGVPNDNGNWKFRDNGTSIIASSSTGIVIAKNGERAIGIILTRKAATGTGANQTLSATLSSQAGGDTNPSNNAAFTNIFGN